MALNDPWITSSHFPYLPIRIHVGAASIETEALLDTGFDDDVVLPQTALPRLGAPAGFERWTLADGSAVEAPYFCVTVELETIGFFPALVTVLGTEALVGIGMARFVTITLDHATRVIVSA